MNAVALNAVDIFYVGLKQIGYDRVAQRDVECKVQNYKVFPNIYTKVNTIDTKH